jgi:hypothetical protein
MDDGKIVFPFPSGTGDFSCSETHLLCNLGRRRRRWEDNIKMDLREVRWIDIDWIYLAKDRYRWRAVVKAVMNLQVP